MTNKTPQIHPIYLNHMRQRLDLDMLLNKYNPRRVLPTSASSPKHFSPTNHIPVKPWTLKTETDYYATSKNHYDSKVPNKNLLINYYQSRDKMASVNFQMSKGQCQNFLLSMREELKQQGMRMEEHVNTSINDLLQKFERDNEIAKRQLLDLVCRSMENNKKEMNQMVENYKNQFVKEYQSPNSTIMAINRQITRLLTALNNSQFRKAIAEVVTKDFEGIVKSVREEVSTSYERHRAEITVVQLNTQKVNIIQDALRNIYQWREHKQAIYNWIPSDEIEDYKHNTRTKNKIFDQSHRIFQSDRRMNQADKPPPKRMRGTFFNFDSNI